MDLFRSSSKATTSNASAGGDDGAAISASDIECPEVQIRNGASTLTIGSKPGDGEPAALDVRYQGTIIRMARECQVNAGVMTMKVGIEGRAVDLLGQLDEYDTVVSGYRVTPFVGVVPYPYPFRRDAREVDQLIEIPLRRLLDPSIFESRVFESQGRSRTIFFYNAGEHLVWGATAAMVHDLLDIVRTLPSSKPLVP